LWNMRWCCIYLRIDRNGPDSQLSVTSMVSEKESNFAYVRCYLAVLRILVAISALLAMRSVFRCSMFTTLQRAVSEQNCPVNGYSDKARRFHAEVSAAKLPGRLSCLPGNRAGTSLYSVRLAPTRITPQRQIDFTPKSRILNNLYHNRLYI